MPDSYYATATTALPWVAGVQTLAGFALKSAAGSILSWTAPDDGVPHRVVVSANLAVSGLMVGGAIAMSCTLPNGQAYGPAIFAGGLTLGTYAFPMTAYFIQPGSVITLNQSSALISGAAAMWAEFRAF